MGYCFIIVSSIVSLDCMADLDYLRVGGSSSLLYASCVLCSAKVFIRRWWMMDAGYCVPSRSDWYLSYQVLYIFSQYGELIDKN